MDTPRADVPLGCLAGNDGLSPSHSPSPEEEGGEESMDVESLGGIGRMFGAMISRFGHIPIPTQIAPEVLRQAKDICASGALDGTGAADDRLCDLVWGWEFEGWFRSQYLITNPPFTHIYTRTQERWSDRRRASSA